MQYTGHPFFDIGLATICGLVEKSDPESLTMNDFKFVANYLEDNYTRDPLKSFLGVAFTTNAWFNQPAFDKQPKKRHEYANRLLRSYDAVDSKSEQKCVFTGEAVTSTAFSDKLPPGKAFRQHVPLLTGEGVINFHPWGDAGLPISGKAALCLQAFPLGCAKCGGRLLAVHSDNPDKIYYFATEFLAENRKGMQLAQQSGSKKMPEAPLSAKTLLIETFLKIEQQRQMELLDNRPASVTAYHLTNSGQSNALDENNPPLAIYYLPLEITAFLQHMYDPRYTLQWKAITKRAWQVSKPAKKGKEQEQTLKPSKNFLYEDLFGLPDNAVSFIRRYFVPISVRSWNDLFDKQDTNQLFDTQISIWLLIELFLRRVIGMDTSRIEKIRILGDTLANYVNKENDRKLFMAIYSEIRYDFFRNALVKANLAWVKQGNMPLITLDSYLDIFEEHENVAWSDWRLARDLVLIRMIEELHRLNWFTNNKDIVLNDIM